IAPIHGRARYYRVLTMHHVSASTGFAHPVFAAEEADTDAFTDRPLGDAAADGIDAAHDLMARHPWELQTRIGTAHCGGIGVTDAAGLHPNSDLADRGLRNGPFDDLQFAGFGDLNRSVIGHGVRVTVPPRTNSGVSLQSPLRSVAAPGRAT